MADKVLNYTAEKINELLDKIDTLEIPDISDNSQLIQDVSNLKQSVSGIKQDVNSFKSEEFYVELLSNYINRIGIPSYLFTFDWGRDLSYENIKKGDFYLEFQFNIAFSTNFSKYYYVKVYPDIPAEVLFWVRGNSNSEIGRLNFDFRVNMDSLNLEILVNGNRLYPLVTGFDLNTSLELINVYVYIKSKYL